MKDEDLERLERFLAEHPTENDNALYLELIAEVRGLRATVQQQAATMGAEAWERQRRELTAERDAARIDASYMRDTLRNAAKRLTDFADQCAP